MKFLAIEIKDIIKGSLEKKEPMELVKTIAAKNNGNIYTIAAKIHLRENSNIEKWIKRVEKIQRESLVIAEERLCFSIAKYINVINLFNS